MKILKNIFKKFISLKIHILLPITFAFQLSANQNDLDFEIFNNLESTKKCP